MGPCPDGEKPNREYVVAWQSGRSYMEYKIVTSESDTGPSTAADKLTVAVAAALAEGWELYGQPFSAGSHLILYQAVTKRAQANLGWTS